MSDRIMESCSENSVFGDGLEQLGTHLLRIVAVTFQTATSDNRSLLGPNFIADSYVKPDDN